MTSMARPMLDLVRRSWSVNTNTGLCHTDERWSDWSRVSVLAICCVCTTTTCVAQVPVWHGNGFSSVHTTENVWMGDRIDRKHSGCVRSVLAIGNVTFLYWRCFLTRWNCTKCSRVSHGGRHPHGLSGLDIIHEKGILSSIGLTRSIDRGLLFVAQFSNMIHTFITKGFSFDGLRDLMYQSRRIQFDHLEAAYLEVLANKGNDLPTDTLFPDSNPSTVPSAKTLQRVFLDQFDAYHDMFEDQRLKLNATRSRELCFLCSGREVYYLVDCQLITRSKHHLRYLLLDQMATNISSPHFSLFSMNGGRSLNSVSHRRFNSMKSSIWSKGYRTGWIQLMRLHWTIAVRFCESSNRLSRKVVAMFV